MPNIKQADLDVLHADLERAEDLAALATERAEVAERKVDQYNVILDKIIAAANGRPLVSMREVNTGAFTPGTFVDDLNRGYDPIRLTPEERQAKQVERLQDRITTLERRLASVVAVAEFAHDHKS